MQHTSKTPFYLYHISVKLASIDHLDHHYIHPGKDGLKLQFYFGGAKMETQKIKYIEKSDEIKLSCLLEAQSISSQKLEIWLKTYTTDKFLGAGDLLVNNLKNDDIQYVNLCIDFHVMASLVFTVEIVKEDISREVMVEEDEVILKKDDTEILRKIQEEKERDIQMKKEQEQQEQIRRAQAKVPIITVTTRNKINQTFL